MNEPTLTDTERETLAETILNTMEVLGVEDATILDTRKIVAENVAPFVAARAAEAVERERADRHHCSRCGLRDIINPRPHDDIVVCEPCMHDMWTDDLDRERAAWATKIETLADEWHHTSDEFAAGNGGWNKVMRYKDAADHLRGLLAADDTEGKP